MNIEELNDVIQHLVPDAKYMIIWGDPYKIKWDDNRRQPTIIEIEDAYTQLKDTIDIKNKKKLILEIEEDMYKYISKELPTHLQLYLNSIYMRYILDIVNKKEPSEYETKAKKIEKIFKWLDSIKDHFEKIVKKINNDIELTKNETDWKELFNKTKPSSIEVLR